MEGDRVRIAVVGLGVMGLPMSLNLVKAGFDVVGYTRTAERGRPLADGGGALAASLAEAVADADVVVTVLPDTPDVQAVCAELFEHAKAGTVLVDMSTIRPDAARELHERAAEVSMPMLDAPVSGGEAGAKEGKLSIMVGGAAETLERVRPVLAAMGTTIVLVGGPGSGQTVKAANQLLVAGTLQLVSEALVFLDTHGVDLEPAVDVLGGGLAGSTVLARKGEAMLAGNFQPGFRVDLHHKDLEIYRSAARQNGVFSPAGALVAELMASLRVTGSGGLDHSALLTQVAALSGVEKWSAR
ncbi:NAD(P)-dependent oxidoreductase [Amycolatopsis sp. NPDC051903]|uniref:NAD(P)-dependent oxidoreductase n=1 Tax=Amycolatopsis sp. NPDC051903 TaxID=3363936 RepID=UPI003792AF7A